MFADLPTSRTAEMESLLGAMETWPPLSYEAMLAIVPIVLSLAEETLPLVLVSYQ